MTEQTQITDIASMLLSEGDNPDLNEATGADEEIQDIIESQPEEAEEVEEAEAGGSLRED